MSTSSTANDRDPTPEILRRNVRLRDIMWESARQYDSPHAAEHALLSAVALKRARRQGAPNGRAPI